MKNFEEIIAKIAEENGTTSENVLREMQLAIDHAYDHHDKEAQKLWDMIASKGVQKSPSQPHLHAVLAPPCRSFSPTFTH